MIDIIGFLMACFLIFISIVFLSIGRDIYGGDATLLFAMGMLCYMGLTALVDVLKSNTKKIKK